MRTDLDGSYYLDDALLREVVTKKLTSWIADKFDAENLHIDLFNEQLSESLSGANAAAAN